MNKFKRTSLIIFFLALAILVGNQLWRKVLPLTPAAYIKSVVAYKEGTDGCVVYFTLADSEGNLTASDGAVKLSFKLDDQQEYSIVDRAVDRLDFHRTTIGIGAFARESLIYPFGRIERNNLWFLKDSRLSGKFVVKFVTPQGRVLIGEESVSF